MEKKNINLAKKKFWESINFLVEKKYDLESKGAFDKFSKLQEDIADLKSFDKVTKHKNFIYRIKLKKIDKSLENLRGKWGLFLRI